MKEIKRIMIHEEQIIDFMDDDIDSAISQLELQGWYRIRYITTSYPYDPNEYLAIHVYRNRLETDDEYEKRITKEKQLKTKQQEVDLKEYNRLKKLFKNQWMQKYIKLSCKLLILEIINQMKKFVIE